MWTAKGGGFLKKPCRSSREEGVLEAGPRVQNFSHTTALIDVLLPRIWCFHLNSYIMYFCFKYDRDQAQLWLRNLPLTWTTCTGGIYFSHLKKNLVSMVHCSRPHISIYVCMRILMMIIARFYAFTKKSGHDGSVQ